MHLCDRGGSQRLVLEVGEYRLDGSAELPLHLTARLHAGKRCHVILQLVQSRHILVREHVAPEAQRLPQFDEGRPEPLQGRTEPIGDADLCLRPQALPRGKEQEGGDCPSNRKQPEGQHDASYRCSTCRSSPRPNPRRAGAAAG